MCPQCGRVVNGKLNPLLSLSELTPGDYDKIFYEEKLPSLNQVFLNGNFGDPVISKHIDYLIEILLKKEISLKIFTNGSLRNTSWWENLGKLFKKTKNEVVFSIDGLKDTNPIYRVNSQWNKIMENASAYLKFGAKARWEFLVFKHNEHQVEQAQALAKKMGFKSFVKKNTQRFVIIEKQKTIQRKSEPLFNKQGQPVQTLEDSSKNDNKFEEVLKKYGSFESYISKTNIHCKYRNDLKGLYIDFMCRVWPCCWLGFPLYYNTVGKPEKVQLESLIKGYEKNFNSLRRHSLSKILSQDWFRRRLVESWKNKTTDDNFRLFTCGKTCGKLFESTSGQEYKNSEKTSLT